MIKKLTLYHWCLILNLCLFSIQEAVFLDRLNQLAVNRKTKLRWVAASTKSSKGLSVQQATTLHHQHSSALCPASSPSPPSIQPPWFLQNSRRTYCPPVPFPFHLLSIPGASSVCSIPHDGPAYDVWGSWVWPATLWDFLLPCWTWWFPVLYVQSVFFWDERGLWRSDKDLTWCHCHHHPGGSSVGCSPGCPEPGVPKPDPPLTSLITVHYLLHCFMLSYICSIKKDLICILTLFLHAFISSGFVCVVWPVCFVHAFYCMLLSVPHFN